MAGKEAFQVEGRVIEARRNRTFCVELANGHRLTAFVAGRAKQQAGGPAPGDMVKLQLTPYDLTTGRILVGTKTI
jgi:translation initiation factor IF-1